MVDGPESLREEEMPRALRVLFVEDSEDDVLLLTRQLERGGFEAVAACVQDGAAMADALRAHSWDVVLCDCSLPTFGPLEALALLKSLEIDLPFIIVSGTIDEDAAVAVMRAGAHDYIPKGRSSRLLPALERELRDAAVRARERELQQQVLIADRMTSLGVVAAGVAHELNNPLAAVVAHLELLTERLSARDLPPGLAEELQSSLHDARDGADRARRIVRELNLFSRASDQLEVVDVERAIEAAMRISWHELRRRARVVVRYRSVAAVRASEARLVQVFLNLLINAGHAVGDDRPAQNTITVSTAMRDGGVWCEVSDTGPGIPGHVLAKLFTPFLTTKPAGLGTGLGLSICQGIINGFGGKLSGANLPERGAVFAIWLPAAPQEVVSDPVPRSAPRRRGRVLVIGDRASPCVAEVQSLSSEHDLVARDQALDALRLIEYGQRFDAILCDTPAPGLTGPGFHRRLLAVAPEQAAALVFLGESSSESNLRLPGDWVNRHLEKPFDQDTLRRLVRALVR
jgi:signal transduction histidine kinase